MPNGMYVLSSPNYPGSVSDIHIIFRRQEAHHSLLRKNEEEGRIMYSALFREEYEDSCAIRCDKGYEGSIEMLRTIYPKRKPLHGHLG